MGNVYVDSAVVGSFEPQQTGISGNVYVDSVTVGTFQSLQESGNVYIDSIQVGTYYITGAPPPPPVTSALLSVGVLLGTNVWSVPLGTWVHPNGTKCRKFGVTMGLWVWSQSQQKWMKGGVGV